MATPLPSTLAELTLDELCRACAVSPEWVGARIHAELLVVEGDGPAAWRFSGSLLRRVQHMQHMERNFDATPELAALVADLSDEIEALRQRLRRAGLG